MLCHAMLCYARRDMLCYAMCDMLCLPRRLLCRVCRIVVRRRLRLAPRLHSKQAYHKGICHDPVTSSKKALWYAMLLSAFDRSNDSVRRLAARPPGDLQRGGGSCKIMRAAGLQREVRTHHLLAGRQQARGSRRDCGFDVGWAHEVSCCMNGLLRSPHAAFRTIAIS
jgi:hypothetical protein